ncbi:MAG: hypothetical protein IKF72_03535 [Kiritimatiellae bacterium]|nr:hypothetical protein [Kiritimatiellia bacterium]
MNENPTAVSVYQQDGVDDFPVLKAFQQYIDAEHAKARNRLVTMGIFFGVLMGAVIAVFVAMLASLSQRNQQLNDRLVDFAMRERERQPTAPVVVQRPTAEDDGMLKSLKDKLDELQKKLSERDAKEEERALAAAAEKQKGPTAEQVEIERLKALLSAEREKAAAEKERKRQEELEAYRRKHYPELYQPVRKPQQVRKQKSVRKAKAPIVNEIDDVLDLLDDDGAIDYFDDENDGTAGKTSEDAEDETTTASANEKEPSSNKPASAAPQSEEKETVQAKTPAQSSEIPVEPKKKNGWRIPNE